MQKLVCEQNGEIKHSTQSLCRHCDGHTFRVPIFTNEEVLEKAGHLSQPSR
jgi:hypothetical protein